MTRQPERRAPFKYRAQRHAAQTSLRSLRKLDCVRAVRTRCGLSHNHNFSVCGAAYTRAHGRLEACVVRQCPGRALCAPYQTLPH